MKRELLGCLAALALGVATPAMAFHGGGGFGGMHGGGGFGGMHGGGFGGMHAGGFGGMHAASFGGMHAASFGGMRGGGIGFRGGMAPINRVAVNNGVVAGRGVFAPGTNRFVGGRFGVAPNRFAFARNRFAFAHNRFFFRHHRFRNVAFFGAPFVAFGGDYYGDYCWRQVWTSYGWQWVNVCYGY